MRYVSLALRSETNIPQFLCQMMFASAFLFGGHDAIHDVWCEDDTTYATISKPACGAQGSSRFPSKY